jgi:hypothetical protein
MLSLFSIDDSLDPFYSPSLFGLHEPINFDVLSSVTRQNAFGPAWSSGDMIRNQRAKLKIRNDKLGKPILQK